MFSAPTLAGALGGICTASAVKHATQASLPPPDVARVCGELDVGGEELGVGERFAAFGVDEEVDRQALGSLAGVNGFGTTGNAAGG
jgi:hypothetical protein